MGRDCWRVILETHDSAQNGMFFSSFFFLLFNLSRVKLTRLNIKAYRSPFGEHYSTLKEAMALNCRTPKKATAPECRIQNAESWAFSQLRHMLVDFHFIKFGYIEDDWFCIMHWLDKCWKNLWFKIHGNLPPSLSV